jgi:cyanophycin synthetase
VKEAKHIADNYPLIQGPLTVEHIRVLQGANYFSGGPVVHMRVNLNEYDEVFTNEIPGFYEKLTMTLPTLIEHHCSEGVRGGFFIRVREGTLLGHVMEHVAIELQTLAGMDVSYGKTRSSSKPGVYNIIFRFFDEFAGLYAGKAALNLINSLLLNSEFDVMHVLEQLITIREIHSLGPATQAITEEVEKRNIPWLRLDEYNLIQIGTGKYQKRIRATLTPSSSLLAVETSQDRVLTNNMLNDAGLPVPDLLISGTAKELRQYITEHPGKYDVRARFRQPDKILSFSVENAERFVEISVPEEEMMLQSSCEGDILRLLVMANAFHAAARIHLPYVIGDGEKNISQLIHDLNNDPQRQQGDKGKLSYVEEDQETLLALRGVGLHLYSVPEKNQKVFVKMSPNPNNGSLSENVTGILHESYKALAVKAAGVIGLDIAAVNIITKSPEIPAEEANAVITEIHAAPNFRMYINPAKGTPENIIPAFVNHVLQGQLKHHIPLISVTGSVGKTMCTSIIFTGLQSMGIQTGLSNSEGLFLSGTSTKPPETADPRYVRLLLKDPDAEAAVVETSVENILQYGLGYQKADYGIVLNIGDCHLNENDISRKDDLAYAKSVVVEEIRPEGYAILNADDPLTSEMTARVTSKIGWFSQHPDSPLCKAILLKKQPLATGTDTNIIVYQNGTEVRIFDIQQYKHLHNPENKVYESVLAAVLCLVLINASDDSIIQSLETCHHELEKTENI